MPSPARRRSSWRTVAACFCWSPRRGQTLAAQVSGDGREKLLAIGAYPEIGLGEARRRREEARELIALGNDPSRQKQRDKVRARIQAADTFTAICNEYCEKRRRDGTKGRAPATAIRSEYLLSLVCGSIGKLPIGEIEPADVLTAIRRIEGKGKLESARRSLQLPGAVFRYAVATARLASDPIDRAALKIRAQLITSRGAFANQLRGMLKLFGLRMGSVTTPGKRRERLAALFTQRPDLKSVFMPLVECIEALEAQLAKSAKLLDTRAASDPICVRLMTAPGVCPVIALTYKASIEDPGRFAHSSDAGAYTKLLRC